MENTSELVIPVNEQDHIQGSKNASLTLVEYGDYQCPYCGAAYPILKEIQSKLGDRLRFVFRNFPIHSAHPYAELAAEAAEAADEQGKFWEMHDALYENQNSLDEKLVMQLAEEISLDLKLFMDALESRKFKDKVKKDFMGGVRSGVNGTPSLFINGKRFDGDLEFDSLYSALSESQ